MCGRFALYTPRGVIASRYFGKSRAVGDLVALYNIAPGRQITAIHAAEGDPAAFDLAWWGFHPHWAALDAPAPINARAETVATSRYFREAFAHRRCLVPANGWYEWRDGPDGKQPCFITLSDPDLDEILFFAGIYDASSDPLGTCCAIITEPASPPLAKIHPRQPLVLDPECRWAWLDPGITDRVAIKAAAHRLAPGRLRAWAVSSRVNRATVDDASLLEPVVQEEI